MNQTFKILAGWLLAFVVVMYFAQQFNKTKTQNEWDYSQFVNSVQSGDTQSVTLHTEDHLITGITKDKTE